MRLSDNQDLLLAVFATAERARSAIAEMREHGRRAASVGILSPAGSAAYESGWDAQPAWQLSFATGTMQPVGPVLAGGFFAGVFGDSALAAEGVDVLAALAPLGIRDEASYFERALCAGRTIVAARGANLDRGSNIVARHRARLGRLYQGASDGICGRTVVSAL